MRIRRCWQVPPFNLSNVLLQRSPHAVVFDSLCFLFNEDWQKKGLNTFAKMLTAFSWISLGQMRGQTLLAPCDKPNPLNSQKCASAPWPIGCAQKSVLRHRRARTDSKFIWAGSKMISISFRWASMLLSRLGAFWTANLAFVTWRRGLRLTRSICATRSAAFRRWFLEGTCGPSGPSGRLITHACQLAVASFWGGPTWMIWLPHGIVSFQFPSV